MKHVHIKYTYYNLLCNIKYYIYTYNCDVMLRLYTYELWCTSCAVRIYPLDHRVRKCRELRDIRYTINEHYINVWSWKFINVDATFFLTVLLCASFHFFIKKSHKLFNRSKNVYLLVLWCWCNISSVCYTF